MLSGFICQCHGVISGEMVASLSAAQKQSIKDLYQKEFEKDSDFNPEFPEHGTFSIILPGAGKGKDGFWGGEDGCNATAACNSNFQSLASKL